MTTATKTARPADQLDELEKLERALPPGYHELCQTRSHIEGQLRHARMQIEEAERSRKSNKSEDIARWRNAISRHEAEIRDAGRFTPEIRRDAALEFLANVPRLREMNQKTDARHAKLMEARYHNALSSAEFAELRAMDEQRTRVTSLLHKSQALLNELRDLVPDHIDAERKALHALAKALVEVPAGGAAGDAAAHLRRWSSTEAARLSEAITTQKWRELAAYQIAPFAR